MAGVRVELRGMADVLRRLQELGRTKAGRILRRALDAATKPILAAARQLVPVESGALRKSLGRRVKTYRGSGVVAVIIGPRRGQKREVERTPKGRLRVVPRKRATGAGGYRNPTRYAHLVERGSRRSKAEPFLAPAMSRCRSQAEATLRRLIIEGIEREA